MPEEFDIVVPCSVCGTKASTVALVHDDGGWRFLYSGIEAGNGSGRCVDDTEGDRITAAFELPLDWSKVQMAGLFDNASFCPECAIPYCYEHWGSNVTGWGTCPNGHGHSLDPHWSGS